MMRFGESFCEDIRQLVKSRDMRQFYLLSNNMLTIVGNFGSTGVVPMKRCRTTNNDTEFTEKKA